MAGLLSGLLTGSKETNTSDLSSLLDVLDLEALLKELACLFTSSEEFELWRQSIPDESTGRRVVSAAFLLARGSITPELVMEKIRQPTEALATILQSSVDALARLSTPKTHLSDEDLLSALNYSKTKAEGGPSLDKDQLKTLLSTVRDCEDLPTVADCSGRTDKMRYRFQKDLRVILQLLVDSLQDEPPRRSKIIETVAVTAHLFQVQQTERKAAFSACLRDSNPLLSEDDWRKLKQDNKKRQVLSVRSSTNSHQPHGRGPGRGFGRGMGGRGCRFTSPFPSSPRQRSGGSRSRSPGRGGGQRGAGGRGRSNGDK